MPKDKTPKKKTPPHSPHRKVNGGILLTGNPGNKGGPGRPPSVIRAELRGTIADRASILTDIMDGVPMQKIEVPFLAVLKHAHCPKCGGSMMSELSTADQLLLTIEGKVSASPKDRTHAWDTAAKYGLGALKDVSAESVQERMKDTLAVIRKSLSATDAQALIAQIRPLWA